MVRENINDLIAFLAVAQERSFTRAAAQLGLSSDRRRMKTSSRALVLSCAWT